MIASLNVRICPEIDGFFALISMAHLSLLTNVKLDRVYSNCFDIIMSILYVLAGLLSTDRDKRKKTLKNEKS